MIIFLSMIFWIVLIYAIYVSGNREEVKLSDYHLNQGIINKVPIGYCVISYAYIVFWVGMRKHFADTFNYITTFQSIPTDFSEAWNTIQWNGKRPGFEIFNILFKCFISSNYTFWLMTIAIICSVCVMIVIRKYSCHFFYSSYLFISLLVFVWMMNGMRQFICVAILFLAVDDLIKGKMVRFIILCVILSTVHISALIMIPVYFVARYKPWKYKIFLFIVVILAITVFAEPFFKGVEDNVGGSNYLGYAATMEQQEGVHPLRFGISFIVTFAAFLKRKQLQSYYEQYPILPICINLSLVSTSLFFLAMFTSGVTVGRFPIFCEIYHIILVPYIIKLGFNESEQKIAWGTATMLFFLYFYLKVPRTYNTEVLGFTNDMWSFYKY